MLDATTRQGRIIRAAMTLAAERPWSKVTLLDIASAAGVSIAEMRGELGSKAEILAAFARQVDDEVLAKVAMPPGGQSARDTLFEVVMSRFDALMPYRPALRSIHADGMADPVLLRAVWSSQTWMLNAAGVPTDGLEGGIKVAGLASVYASVFATWLEDDDPGLARTMAALDRRLRRGERTLSSLDEITTAVKRVASIFAPGSPSRSDAPEARGGATTPEPDRPPAA